MRCGLRVAGCWVQNLEHREMSVLDSCRQRRRHFVPSGAALMPPPPYTIIAGPVGRTVADYIFYYYSRSCRAHHSRLFILLL